MDATLSVLVQGSWRKSSLLGKASSRRLNETYVLIERQWGPFQPLRSVSAMCTRYLGSEIKSSHTSRALPHLAIPDSLTPNPCPSGHAWYLFGSNVIMVYQQYCLSRFVGISEPPAAVLAPNCPPIRTDANTSLMSALTQAERCCSAVSLAEHYSLVQNCVSRVRDMN